MKEWPLCPTCNMALTRTIEREFDARTVQGMVVNTLPVKESVVWSCPNGDTGVLETAAP